MPHPADAASTLVFRWDSARRPVPIREVRPGARHTKLPRGLGALLAMDTGPPNKPFDFSAHVRRLCEDIAARVRPLWHIDVSRILFSFTQARNGRGDGLQARLTPLRFPGGGLVRRHRGTDYQVQRFVVDGREALYILTFCLPRFLDRDADDKFVTLFHELYHISPAFDGDLRRHEGRCSVHSASRERYDREMAALARSYLANGADRSRSDFLRLNFAQLRRKHGSVVARHVPRPRLIPLQDGGIR